MKISLKDFRVKEGDEVNVKKWPTTVKPVYKSKKQTEPLAGLLALSCQFYFCLDPDKRRHGRAVQRSNP
jgi:hypothetical protein